MLLTAFLFPIATSAVVVIPIDDMFLILPTKSPSAEPIQDTSYRNFKEIGLNPQTLPNWADARAYGSFSGSGHTDLFTASLTYWPPTTPAEATPSVFQFWLKQADGTFIEDKHLLSSNEGCIHPRKAVVADFNLDGHPDIFVACHGWDAPPFPGENNKILLSQTDSTYLVKNASKDIGFFHSVAAADLNGDDYPDVIVANNFDPESVFVLLNDGNGSFYRESISRLPSSIYGKNYFSVELVDINGDEKLDILLGGHEWEGANTVAIINPGSNDFSGITPTIIPPVSNEGVVLDFVVTRNDEGIDIWILRTSGGDGTFYQSRTVQKVNWPSLMSTIPLNERPERWVPWIIPSILNKGKFITTDNAADGVTIPQ